VQSYGIKNKFEESKEEEETQEPKCVILKVVKGRIFIDTEIFGEMDPYIELYHNGKHYKTILAKSGGKRPTWNSSLEI
jgi:hypothetical protein